MNDTDMINNLYHLSELMINKFHLREGAIEAYRKFPLAARFILLGVMTKPFNTRESEFSKILSQALQGYTVDDGRNAKQYQKFHDEHIEDLRKFYEEYIIKGSA